MHLHILGICGTFMGGLAAIAQGGRPRVTGCDANVYPPMSTQLAALGIELTEGLDAAQLRGVARDADVVRHRQRRVARQSADGGDPRRRPAVRLGAAVALRERAARPLGARGRRHARQDDDDGDARVDPRARGPGARIPDRRRAGRLPRVGAAHRQRVLRHRGRRVRHGVLRQALEVRPLPAAHGDPQQPRVRPRRHLSRPGRDRDAVPPPGAHGAGQRAASSPTAARRASRACSRAAAGARSSASASPRCRAPGPTGRSPSTARSCWAARRRARWRSASRAGTTS